MGGALSNTTSHSRYGDAVPLAGTIRVLITSVLATILSSTKTMVGETTYADVAGTPTNTSTAMTTFAVTGRVPNHTHGKKDRPFIT